MAEREPRAGRRPTLRRPETNVIDLVAWQLRDARRFGGQRDDRDVHLTREQLDRLVASQALREESTVTLTVTSTWLLERMGACEDLAEFLLRFRAELQAGLRGEVLDHG